MISPVTEGDLGANRLINDPVVSQYWTSSRRYCSGGPWTSSTTCGRRRDLAHPGRHHASRSVGLIPGDPWSRLEPLRLALVPPYGLVGTGARGTGAPVPASRRHGDGDRPPRGARGRRERAVAPPFLRNGFRVEGVRRCGFRGRRFPTCSRSPWCSTPEPGPHPLVRTEPSAPTPTLSVDASPFLLPGRPHAMGGSNWSTSRPRGPSASAGRGHARRSPDAGEVFAAVAERNDPGQAAGLPLAREVGIGGTRVPGGGDADIEVAWGVAPG